MYFHCCHGLAGIVRLNCFHYGLMFGQGCVRTTVPFHVHLIGYGYDIRRQNAD